MSVTDWADMCPQTISHQAVASRDAYGKPTYGTGVDYSGRVVLKSTKVTSFTGDEVAARGHAILLGTPTISPEDQLTLPDGTIPVLLAIEEYPDEEGDHHVKVYFGGRKS